MTCVEERVLLACRLSDSGLLSRIYYAWMSPNYIYSPTAGGFLYKWEKKKKNSKSHCNNFDLQWKKFSSLKIAISLLKIISNEIFMSPIHRRNAIVKRCQRQNSIASAKNYLPIWTGIICSNRYFGDDFFFLFVAEKVSFILSAMKHKCRRWKLTFSSEIGFAIENFAHKS